MARKVSFYINPLCSLTVLLLIIPAFFCVSCTKEQQQKSEAAPEYIKTYENGPVTIEVRLTKKEITVAEFIQLTLIATTPENYAVTLPREDADFGEFTPSGFQAAKLELSKPGTIRKKKTFALEPFLAGKYSIPSQKVIFTKKDNESLTIETEPIDIKVKSLFTADEPPKDINEILPPAPPPPNYVIWYIAAAVALLIIGLITWYCLREKKAPPPPPPLPPDIIAKRELDSLLSQGLLIRGEIKKFHFLLTDILRRYIERRFTIKAPEQTTEEFLQEIGNTSILSVDHKVLLKKILSYCDLVKFAKYFPEKEEIDFTVELTSQFITESAQTVGVNREASS